MPKSCIRPFLRYSSTLTSTGSCKDGGPQERIDRLVCIRPSLTESPNASGDRSTPSSRDSSGTKVVHLAFRVRSRRSNRVKIPTKTVGYSARMTLYPVSNAGREQAAILVMGLETSEETQIGPFIACTGPLLRASALLLSCAILPLNPQNDLFSNSETILTP